MSSHISKEFEEESEFVKVLLKLWNLQSSEEFFEIERAERTISASFPFFFIP